MKIIGLQTPEEALAPKGFVIPNEPYYKLVEQKKYDPKTRITWCSGEIKEDLGFYQIDGVNFNRPFIKSGFCRKCQKKISPYKKVYYKKVFECSSWNSWIYSAANGYCENCAIEETKNIWSENNPLFVTKIIHESWGYSSPYTLDRIEYSDGSVVESDSRDPIQNPMQVNTKKNKGVNKWDVRS